jgi:hypothetical protein
MKVSGKIFLFVLIASGFFTQYSGATVYRSNGSVSNVQALHDYYARDGDTITLPAGTFSWTSRLNIKKGITLQGETTITGAGTSNPTVTDATIIQDNTPRSGTGIGIITAAISSSQSFRLTGITFAPGTSTKDAFSNHGAFRLFSLGSTSMRIDHCHFASLHQAKIICTSGWVYGVADHNYIEVIRNHFPFFFMHDAYSQKSHGDGAWADYPWYGTDKFFFVEDNTVVRHANTVNTIADASLGARYVIRHNYVKNCIPTNHGTEGRGRGSRAQEVYNNTFEITVPCSGGGIRSGTMMWHDNAFLGVKPRNNKMCSFGNYREFRYLSTFGQAIGDNVWDANDTEGNGTHVEGHPPYLFDSGTATSSTAGGTLVDSTKNWTPNQWVGYSIKCSSGSAAPSGTFIVSNTATTITYFYDTGSYKPVVFHAGDSYQIHRVLAALDECARGKGNLLSGNLPINTATGTKQWPHNALEPCYSWNNTYTPDGTALVTGPGQAGQPTPKGNVGYFNLGSGFAANTTPSAVSSTYTAALNGVDYVGPFTYPHPLALGAPKAIVTDCNGDAHPDYVLQNAATRQTAIWYLNNNVFISAAYGPTLAAGWGLSAVTDFNLDSHSDYALFAPSTHQTAIWYLSGPTFIGGAYGPTLPSGWELVATADFNGNGYRDYVLYNSGTRQTAIWYLNSNVFAGGAYGPTLPPGWSLVAVADFNRDGHPDYALFKPVTGQTAIWYLSGPTFIGGAYGPTLPGGWALVAAADFNGDNYRDYVLYNSGTRQTAIWYLNNNVFAGGAYGPTLPAAWSWVEP